jgi:putative membrane protein
MPRPHQQPYPPRKPSALFPRKALTLFAKGFCMGASDVVPGVSGGTMALILGIYEELIAAIKAFDATFVRDLLQRRLKKALGAVPFAFLISLGLGILTAIFTLARGLSWLLVHHPIAIWSFFFGLVLASAVVVARRIQHWLPTTFISLLLFTAGAYLLVGLVPVHTPETLPFIFLCGAIAICAMILPGISGSFILVLLGKYQYILDAVGRFDLVVLSVFAAGTAVGITLFVRLLNWMLTHHHDLAMAALTGLMIGSLRKIWPWKAIRHMAPGNLSEPHVFVNILPDHVSTELFVAVGLAIAGGMLVLLLQRIADR